MKAREEVPQAKAAQGVETTEAGSPLGIPLFSTPSAEQLWRSAGMPELTGQAKSSRGYTVAEVKAALETEQ